MLKTREKELENTLLTNNFLEKENRLLNQKLQLTHSASTGLSPGDSLFAVKTQTPLDTRSKNRIPTSTQSNEKLSSGLERSTSNNKSGNVQKGESILNHDENNKLPPHENHLKKYMHLKRSPPQKN